MRDSIVVVADGAAGGAAVFAQIGSLKKSKKEKSSSWLLFECCATLVDRLNGLVIGAVWSDAVS